MLALRGEFENKQCGLLCLRALLRFEGEVAEL